MFLPDSSQTKWIFGRKNQSMKYFQGSVMNGQGYILTIIVFSVAYNIVKFFEFETVMMDVEDEITGEM